MGWGELRSPIFHNFPQFRNFPQFPQFFRHSFRPVHFVCLLVPFAFADNCCNNMLQCFPAPKKTELCLNFMVILRATCRRNSDTCGQFDVFQHASSCAELLLLEDSGGSVWFGYNTAIFPQLFRNLPQFSRSFPHSSCNFSLSDWTLSDCIPPPLVQEATTLAMPVAWPVRLGPRAQVEEHGRGGGIHGVWPSIGAGLGFAPRVRLGATGRRCAAPCPRKRPLVVAVGPAGGVGARIRGGSGAPGLTRSRAGYGL